MTTTPAPDRHYLSKEEIRDAPGLQLSDLEMPSWGGWVQLLSLSLPQIEALTDACMIIGPDDKKVLDQRAYYRRALEESLQQPKLDAAEILHMLHTKAAVDTLRLIKFMNKINGEEGVTDEAAAALFRGEPPAGAEV